MAKSFEDVILLLIEKMGLILHKMEKIEQKTLPDRYWYDLKTLCKIKNISYKTVCQRKYLQPEFGVAEKVIAGKKQWSITTILNTKWLYKSDEELLKEFKSKNDTSNDLQT